MRETADRPARPFHHADASRTAEKIVKRYFDGEPWITRGAPVVSTSTVVTMAVVIRGLSAMAPRSPTPLSAAAANTLSAMSSLPLQTM